MAEVTVDASWRMSRVEFNTPYAPGGTIVGFGEVLLQEPSTPVPGVFRGRGAGAGAGKTYGTMPGATVTRVLVEVADDKVEIDGVTVSFSQAMQAMESFLQKWLVEDAEKPEPGAVPSEEPTSVPVLGAKPPQGDELPHPLDPFAPLGPEPTPPVDPMPHGEER